MIAISSDFIMDRRIFTDFWPSCTWCGKTSDNQWLVSVHVEEDHFIDAASTLWFRFDGRESQKKELDLSFFFIKIFSWKWNLLLKFNKSKQVDSGWRCGYSMKIRYICLDRILIGKTQKSTDECIGNQVGGQSRARVIQKRQNFKLQKTQIIVPLDYINEHSMPL